MSKKKKHAAGCMSLKFNGAQGARPCDCDGYHTFEELYDHRITLWVTFCRFLAANMNTVEVWRSRLHSDGSEFEGWFVLGVEKKKGQQMTYHLPMREWDATDFAETLERGPEFDGHNASDVLARLGRFGR